MTHRARLSVLPGWTCVAACAVALASSVGSSEVTWAAGLNFRDNKVTPTVCRHCGSSECECELICCPEKVTETEKKSFWKVTCEYVCIPGFRFPWECKKNACGCESLVCGRVRAVNILEQEDYECETCGYKWEVKCVRSSGELNRAGGDCQCPRCAERERVRVASEERRARK